ncbi:MAG TPA: hypothetical protein VHV77_17635 [Pirellulales bacterium]|jgi:hypothetical protein|nr:hypothetical protein [Pirellulales bacterium]
MIANALRRYWLFVLATGCVALAGSPTSAAEKVVVQFDIPDRIECSDVTPEKCAAKHPNLKVIEAKFRISATLLEGKEADIVDFDYMISSPELRLKILDYLPNTTLESTYTGDQIEVADSTETNESASEEAKVAYSVLSLSGSLGQSAKKSEQNHYKRVAPKALVLASGTTNRGHGVFFKLRPSNAASLEGAKEFTFLAVVPKSWRGDWCSFVCVARSQKRSLLGNQVVMAGIQSAHVGLYLSGDHDASEISDQLCQLQIANNGVLARQLAKEATISAEALLQTSEFHHSNFRWEDLSTEFNKLKPGAKHSEQQLEQARASVHEVEERLKALSGAVPSVASKP